MAFNYSFSVCTTSSAETSRFVAEWVGSGHPESVTSVQVTSERQSTIYGLGFKLTDSKGRIVSQRAHYSLDGKLYFAVNGYDFRSYEFPLQYSIRYGTDELIAGSITDNCSDTDGGDGGGGSGAGGQSGDDQQSDPLPEAPSVPPTPCLPPQPSASAPPVPTPCSGSYGAAGTISGFGTR
jgi:hypothetical protein